MFEDTFIQAVNKLKLRTYNQIFKKSQGVKFSRWKIFIISQDIKQSLIYKIVNVFILHFDLFDILLCKFVFFLFSDAFDQMFSREI